MTFSQPPRPTHTFPTTLRILNNFLTSFSLHFFYTYNLHASLSSTLLLSLLSSCFSRPNFPSLSSPLSIISFLVPFSFLFFSAPLSLLSSGEGLGVFSFHSPSAFPHSFAFNLCFFILSVSETKPQTLRRNSELTLLLHVSPS